MRLVRVELPCVCLGLEVTDDGWIIEAAPHRRVDDRPVRPRSGAQKVNRSKRSLMSPRPSRGGAGAPPVW
jgi:hypothetical protein